jgi:hypothetical protein
MADEAVYEYVLVGIRRDHTFILESVHEDFEDARTAALKHQHPFVSVPISRDWTVLQTEHGRAVIQIHKVRRFAKPEQPSRCCDK